MSFKLKRVLRLLELAADSGRVGISAAQPGYLGSNLIFHFHQAIGVALDHVELAHLRLNRVEILG